MDVSKAFVSAVESIMPMFGMEPVFQGEAEEAVLTSANQVNVIIGFTDGLKGNVMVGFKKSTALRVAESMMSGMEVKELDDVSESAVAEMVNMFVGGALGRLESKETLNFSPPTIAIGERMFLMISRVRSRKLNFKLGDDLFNVAVAIE